MPFTDSRLDTWLRHGMRRYFRFLLKGVDHVAVLTDIAARRLCTYYPVANRRCSVIPNGCAPLPKNDVTLSPAIMNRLAPLRGRFCCVYVACAYPHKNHAILLDVARRIQTEGLADQFAIIVTVAPESGDYARRFLAEVESKGLSSLIVNLGEIPHEMVFPLYRAADALFMPTLLESLAIPYLEAMQLGLPILTSDRDFSRFVCADAAQYFDPLDASDIFNTLSLIAHNSERRQELIVAGQRRFSSYAWTWDEVAKAYVHLLHTLAASSRDLPKPSLPDRTLLRDN